MELFHIFLKAIRPSEPSFQKINLLSIIEDTLMLREKELNNKKNKSSNGGWSEGADDSR